MRTIYVVSTQHFSHNILCRIPLTFNKFTTCVCTISVASTWSIENGQHWVLDVTFGEDYRRQQDRNGASNLAAVRRLSVSLLRQEQSLKRGAKCKRMNCALDPNYLLKVFTPLGKIDA